MRNIILITIITVLSSCSDKSEEKRPTDVVIGRVVSPDFTGEEKQYLLADETTYALSGSYMAIYTFNGEIRDYIIDKYKMTDGFQVRQFYLDSSDYWCIYLDTSNKEKIEEYFNK